MAERLTEELLDELLSTSDLNGYLDEDAVGHRTLADYLQELLDQKGLEQAQVVRMADLNSTFGYQIFKGTRNPSRDKVLQVCFAMALTLREANRALTAAGASELYAKDRRDAIIIFCLDRGCSLQKVNEELYRFGEKTLS